MKKYTTISKCLCYVMIIGLTFIKSYADSNELTKIKQAIKQEGLNWTAKETWVTRLSPQQKKTLFMSSFTPPLLKQSKIITLPQQGDLPSSLDWRNISQNGYQGNYVTPIRNQGNCGSCWAFSAVAQIESWWLIDNNRPDTTLDLSEQILLSNGDNNDCEGGNPVNGLEWAQQRGIPPEWCFEYRADDTIPLDSACADWQDYVYTIPGWNYITGSEDDVNNIKNALLYHPVSASYEILTDFSYYYNGVYEPVDTSSSTGFWHAILIIGWNDADSCWICKNSWGPNWGETDNFEPVGFGTGNGGYFRIKWGVCHIGEYIPFIWNEIGAGNYFTIGEDSVHITLTQGESGERSITLANSGPDNIDFAAFGYSASVKFHVDDFNAYEGTSWWCGDPELGGYDNHWLQYLQTSPLNLKGTQNPELTWKGFWAVEDPAGAEPPWDGWDGCNVWISTDGGDNYTVAEPESPDYNCQHLWSFGSPDEGWDLGTDIAGWGGTSDGWTDVRFDLSSYKQEAVIIRWAFASDLAYCTEDESSLYGYFVDDVRVKDGTNVIFENYGEDNGEMLVDGFSGETADWLSITNGVGTVPAGGQFIIHLIIDSKDLEPGNYEGSISFTVSDTLQDQIIIPVFLTVEEKESAIADNNEIRPPDSIQLLGNYPNPFNPSTNITYYLPQRSFVKITIYDIRGRKIRTLINEMQNPGMKSTTWNGKNESHESVGSGMYIYSLQSEETLIHKKMLLIR